MVRQRLGLEEGAENPVRGGLVGCTGNQLSRDNIEIEHESGWPCSAACIFKFASLHLTGQHGQIRMFAFLRLNTRHFIGTFDALALLG